MSKFLLWMKAHLLVKLSCQSVCENLDAISVRYAVCFFNQYCSWPRIYRGRHCDCAFYIYTTLTYTNTRSIEAEQRLCSKTPTAEVGLQNLRACRRGSSCPILESPVDVRMQLITKTLESLTAFVKCLDFKSLYVRKCYCGSTFLRYLH